MKAPPLKFIFLLAILVRATWWFIGLQHPSSDDLQYALMAEAIRHRESFPLVAWAIGYGGTITTSWVLAGLFSLFGPSLPVVLGYGALLSLLQLFLWIRIAERLHPGSGGWVGLLLAVPSAHMGFLMQQLSYADALAVGALVVWCVVRWSNQKALSARQSFILAGLTGYLFYTHPIPTVFAAAILLLWRKRIQIPAAASIAGMLIGVSPLLLANILMRGITIRRIGARMLNMNAEQFSSNTSAGHLAVRLVQQCWVGLKAQPRLIAEAFSSDLGLTSLGIAAAAGILMLLVNANRPSIRARWIAWPIITATLVGNALFGDNARARYLMPAYASSSLLAGTAAALGGIPGRGVALFVTVLNSIGTWQRVRETPAGIPYDAAVVYLNKQGLHFGYADFWQSLPLTFLSKGSLKVASTATDAKGFWDRTVEVTAEVDRAPDVFYVFDSTNSVQRQFIKAFETLIESQQIRCEKTEIPPLRIYSRLSRPVRPIELDAVYRSLRLAPAGASP